MPAFDANAFATAEAATTENTPPPEPGTYGAMIRDARAFTSQKGDDWVVVSWELTTGIPGYKWDDLRGFKSPAAVSALKAFLASLGIPVENITSLEQMDTYLKACIGEWYDIEVKQKGQFLNLFVNGRVEAPAKPSVESVEDMFPPKDTPANTANTPAGSTIDW